MLSLFRGAAKHGFYAARITRVEVTSALVRKHRGNHLTSDARTRALARLRRDFLQTRIFTVEITLSVLQNAESLAEKHGLRGYDAVQLAAALEANAERTKVGLASLMVVTADSDLLSAAIAEGFSTDDPNNH